MLLRKNSSHYAKILSKKHKISYKDANKLIKFILLNLCKRIENGEDIRIRGFGTFYFDKEKQMNYLRKVKASNDRIKIMKQLKSKNSKK